LLDSGAFHHVFTQKFFFFYQSIDDNVVFMGNDISCKTVGIERIKLKMFDGIVQMLMYVRHVHELKNNLISLGVLDSGGYMFIGQGG
jgi:hypothetical protein